MSIITPNDPRHPVSQAIRVNLGHEAACPSCWALNDTSATASCATCKGRGTIPWELLQRPDVDTDARECMGCARETELVCSECLGALCLDCRAAHVCQKEEA